MLFAICYQVLQSRGAMPQILALLLRSADLTFVPTASELKGQEDKIEPEPTSQSESKEIRGMQEQYYALRFSR